MSAISDDRLVDHIERRFRVVGHVQGVGFRWWTRNQAQRLGISGHVKNLADGAVEVRARGSTDSIRQLAELLQQGPAGSAVARVEDEADKGIPEGDFAILH